jgi:hypothetical protein
VTEADWLAAADPLPMLAFLRGRASERKLRLFAVACCRRIWPLLTDERSRSAVEIAERYADGLAGALELQGAAEQARLVKDALDAAYHRLEQEHDTAYRRLERSRRPTFPAGALLIPGLLRAGASSCAATAAAWCAESHDEFTRAEATAGAEITAGYAGPAREYETWDLLAAAGNLDAEEWRAVEQREKMAQAALLREVFGNPVRPCAAVDGSWLAWNGGIVAKLAAAVYADRAFDRLPLLADALEDAGCGDVDLLGHLRGPGPHVRGCRALDLVLDRR